jgi:hypothetical protein
MIEIGQFFSLENAAMQLAIALCNAEAYLWMGIWRFAI